MKKRITEMYLLCQLSACCAAFPVFHAAIRRPEKGRLPTRTAHKGLYRIQAREGKELENEASIGRYR